MITISLTEAQENKLTPEIKEITTTKVIITDPEEDLKIDTLPEVESTKTNKRTLEKTVEEEETSEPLKMNFKEERLEKNNLPKKKKRKKKITTSLWNSIINQKV